MSYDKNTHKYTPPEFEFYVMTRNEDVRIVAAVKDTDSLYGMGSWDLFAGPFKSWDDVCNLGLPWWDTLREKGLA